MGFLNPGYLLSKEAQISSAASRDALAIYWFTAILSIPLLCFGVFRIVTTSGSDRLIGFTEIVLFSALLANALLYRKHRRADITKPLVSLIAALLVIVLIFSDGIGRTGIFWYLALMSAGFPFLGVRMGTISNLLYSVMLMTIAAGTYFEIFQTPYDINEYLQAFMVSTVLTLSNLMTARDQNNYQKKISTEQTRVQALLQELPAGVILFSVPKGQPTLSNVTMETMLGQAIRDDISIEDFIMIYRLTMEDGVPIAAHELAPAITLTEGRKAKTPILYIHRKDGTKIMVRVNSAPIKNQEGQLTAVISVFEDITKRRRTERDKAELISLTSKQLQKPMSEIERDIETVLSDKAEGLSDDQRQMIEPLKKNIGRLRRFIDNLLSVDETDNSRESRINPLTINVVPLLKVIADEFQIIAGRRQVELLVDLPQTLNLKVDKDEFRELFTNLIGNAVKYSTDGGLVTISMRSTPESKQTLVVHDDGIGIPKNEQKQIFRRFFRASNVNDGVEGTGLGLYIAKKVVNAHGGRIWFESKEGEGTSFFVALPLGTEDPGNSE